MNSIQELWVSYEAMIVPPDAGATQREETRRAFFAGAAAILGTMADMGNKNLSPAAGAGILRGMKDECLAFFEHEMPEYRR